MVTCQGDVRGTRVEKDDVRVGAVDTARAAALRTMRFDAILNCVGCRVRGWDGGRAVLECHRITWIGITRARIIIGTVNFV